MDNQAAAQAYREATFENAPPIKIIRMLYQGAIRFIDQAEREDHDDPKSRYHDLLFRVDSILTELRLALDHEQSPDVCENLKQLYLYSESRIAVARAEHDMSALDDVREILRTLLEAWDQVEVDTGLGEH
jgi:flagellar protein FliS